MSHTSAIFHVPPTESDDSWCMPSCGLGWCAIWLTVGCALALLAFPQLSMAFRGNPVLDGWPIIAAIVLLVDAAAATSAAALSVAHERSVAVVVTLVITVPSAIFATLAAIGSGGIPLR